MWWRNQGAPKARFLVGSGILACGRKRMRWVGKNRNETLTDYSFFIIQNKFMIQTKYFLYARKSTEDDDKQIMSIEAQLFELREFARKENLQILEEFTESKSAKKPGREKFGEMMGKIESLDGVGILAWHPDRLARNSIDGGRIIYAVDTTKIVSLRFPTFWFEPTPQGLFMLQVAFGQSKYYSDNLKQNVERGIRQKLRRGEWLTRAPFGYINNPKTRNIDPDPVKSKIIVRAFEEFAKGNHGYESLSQFLSLHGITTKSGTPLCKASVSCILKNKAYLGLTKHFNEYFPGSFAPILSTDLFEAVQKRLQERAHPRKTKVGHNFPFTGLFRCGECGSMITAQWCTNRWGVKYRYYRCTKKKGKCFQSYLREDLLVLQLKEQLQKISLPDEWTNYMLRKTDDWNREEKVSSGSELGRIKDIERETEQKLDELVSLYLDGDIPKENYLSKKNELLKQKVSLAQKMDTARTPRKNWVEPLREWILDMKKATQLESTEDFFEIRDYFKKIGTNPQLRDKSVSVSFCPPTAFACARKPESPNQPESAPSARPDFSTTSSLVSECDPTQNRTALPALRRLCPNR
jgi:site-specific DNA recombinase